jgi:hypothetical protein
MAPNAPVAIPGSITRSAACPRRESGEIDAHVGPTARRKNVFGAGVRISDDAFESALGCRADKQFDNHQLIINIQIRNVKIPGSEHDSRVIASGRA